VPGETLVRDHRRDDERAGDDDRGSGGIVDEVGVLDRTDAQRTARSIASAP
jgi:hypothetical protein